MTIHVWLFKLWLAVARHDDDAAAPVFLTSAMIWQWSFPLFR